MENEPGVYQIECISSSKYYIGSSVKMRQRKYCHLSMLRRGCHTNKHLQHSFTKYGEDSFVFKVLEYCHKDTLLDREQFWITSLDAANPKRGMNNSPTATNGLGFRHSEHTKQYLSHLAKQRDHTHLLEYSHSMRGRLSPSKGTLGKKWTDEQKRAASLARKGKAAWNKGLRTPEETKKKIKESCKNLNIKYTYEQQAMCKKLREARYTWKAISEQTGIPLASVYRLVRGLRTYEKKSGVTK